MAYNKIISCSICEFKPTDNHFERNRNREFEQEHQRFEQEHNDFLVNEHKPEVSKILTIIFQETITSEGVSTIKPQYFINLML